MTITALSATGATPAAKTAKQVLGQEEFIRLMTAQMSMQDPTNPVDNKDMIAQMAQFSSLSGIENINSTLRAISAQLDQVLAAQGQAPTTA